MTLETLEKKIHGYRSIREIVNSMKALAAMAIRKVEDILLSTRLYGDNIEDAIAQILHYYPETLKERKEEEGKKLIVVFASEQGLCGLYNERVVEQAERLYSEERMDFILSGSRGYEEALSRGIPVEVYLSSPVSVEAINLKVTELAYHIEVLNTKKRYKEIRLLFTYLKRKGDYEVINQRVLPPPFKRIIKRKKKKRQPLLYMPADIILENLLREYLLFSLYRAYLEALASENSYRLISMEKASSSIDEKIDELNSFYNYLRQEEITNETIEISSSFETLRK